MDRKLLIVLRAALLSAWCLTGQITHAQVDSLSINVKKINFSTGQPNRVVYQNLLWRGGVSLKSKHPFFGGLSGIELSKNGKQMLAVSDHGFWLKADISYKNGKINTIKNAKITQIKNSKGNNVPYKRRDTEGIAKLNGSLDNVIVSVEGNHAIYGYKFENEGLNTPSIDLGKVDLKLSHNLGLEAITLLQKPHRYSGWILAIAEKKLNKNGDHSGWLIKKKQNRPFYIKRSEGYNITDVGYLPNGDVVILERVVNKYTGPGMRIRQFCGRDIKPNNTLTGKTLLDANVLYSIDNMEGLAVHTAANGETVLTIVSDDNYRFYQRTLMLQFSLVNESSIC